MDDLTSTLFAAPAPAPLAGSGRIVAGPGFNRWLVPPAALAIHLCIGTAYGFSVFWLPLSHALGVTGPVACAGNPSVLQALVTTTCDWRVADISFLYTLFFVVFGLSAALLGGWLERVGPRVAGIISTVFWCSGLLVSAGGIYLHQLWLLWLGAGFIGGIGLGIGYLSPISTLVRWFPERRGMATGMAIMGFGGGALIGGPLFNILMDRFHTETSVGVWQCFVVLAAISAVSMLIGAFSYRVPPANWQPEGWEGSAAQRKLVMQGNVFSNDAQGTLQFWLIWIVICLNASAGIGILGVASPMLQEMFAGALIGHPGVGLADLDAEQKRSVSTLAASFVGLLALFNISGRLIWSSISDKIGRKAAYAAFFIVGCAVYALSPWAAHSGNEALFVAMMCLVVSIYGGGFATVPAYLADMFGTRFVSVLHGRVLTALSTASIIGPMLIIRLRESQIAAGVPASRVYDGTLYMMAGLLAVGFVANLFIRPVDVRLHIPMRKQAIPAFGDVSVLTDHSQGIGRGGLTGRAALVWACVGLPLLWGMYITLSKAVLLFA